MAKKTKKVTLRDISEKLGLSTAAVSKALRGHEGISEATRELVLETARTMEYKGVPEQSPDAAPNAVVFIIVNRRELKEPHTMSTYYFIDNALKTHGCQVAIHGVPIDGDDQAIFDLIERDNPLALFLFGRFSQKFAEQLQATGKIMIVIDHDFPSMNFDVVLTNDNQGAFAAVRHLVHLGHQRIGYIGDNSLSPTFHDRYNGFIDAIRYWGLELNEKHIYDLHFINSFGDIDYSPVMERLDADDLPTAFFCANDPIAYILSNGLNARGIKVPEDVSIVGFDNLESSQFQYPPLTTLDYPREHIAQTAVELLVWRMHHPQAPCRKILVQPRLVERKSTAIPHKPAL
ncbi:LacI family DNA-binding transcriptional regulator [Cohnella nanjingensis]|uniref:LacI family DNA-binding transcriptional regulator n=1 Tax=Cohnella nanjingensis TaxID=1387779 RepID=A0A7X0RSN7_9BACL|nr:LacI family DNA-binding transcriptional regulator [Cohnella nanjingensis]MBB6672978.1 LacI family DNA-binding transcriptional regulator [Cohnella nanjingensis]